MEVDISADIKTPKPKRRTERSKAPSSRHVKSGDGEAKRGRQCVRIERERGPAAAAEQQRHQALLQAQTAAKNRTITGACCLSVAMYDRDHVMIYADADLSAEMSHELWTSLLKALGRACARSDAHGPATPGDSQPYSPPWALRSTPKPFFDKHAVDPTVPYAYGVLMPLGELVGPDGQRLVELATAAAVPTGKGSGKAPRSTASNGGGKARRMSNPGAPPAKAVRSNSASRVAAAAEQPKAAAHCQIISVGLRSGLDRVDPAALLRCCAPVCLGSALAARVSRTRLAQLIC